MAKRKTKNSASNTDNAELTRKSTSDSDSTNTTCQTDMKEQTPKLKIKQDPAGKNGRPGQGGRRTRKVSQSQSRMAVGENQSGEAAQPGTAAGGSGKAKGRPIPGGRRQAKWFAIAVITIAFIAFIALSFPRTP
ncbi:MAG: hypothetical protein ACYSWW_22765, partial [Planctomycetota bacterium]